MFPTESRSNLIKRCVCGSWNISKLWGAPQKDIDFIFCKSCKLVFIHPMPTEDEVISRYSDYLKDYVNDKEYFEDRKNGAKRLKTIFLREAKLSFHNRRKKPRLLDVGCGLGFFLKEVEDMFEIYGIEVSSFQVEFARQKLGLNVFQGTLLDAKFPDEYFDVITLWEVIEHLPNPLEYIREINRILKPGGMLALSTPNFRGLTSLITKDKWHLCDPKEHLFYFSNHSLKNILSGTGFKITRAVTENINLPNIIRYIKKESLETAQIWSEKKLFLKAIESNLFLRTFKKCINYFLNITKRGDNLRIYAKKASLGKDVKTAKKILIFNNHGIGDVVVSIPLLKAIRFAFPEANISILLRSEIEKDVIEPLNLCNNYFYFQRIKKGFVDNKTNLFQTLKLIWKWRKEKFEIALTTQGINILLAGLLSFIVGAKYRVGEGVGWKASLFNIRVFPSAIHRIYRNNNIGRSFGLNSFISHPYLVIDETAEITVDRIFEEKRLYEKKNIGIHIGNPKDSFERCWSVEKYKELINKVNKAYSDIVFVIFGASSEKTIVEKIDIKNFDNVLDLVGVLEIKETMAFIKRCKLLISGDGGLMHIAAALNVPTISLFGPTNSDVIAPYWNNGVVVRANIPCSPCYDNEDYRKECKDIKCMEYIEVEDVFKIVSQMLRNEEKRSKA